MRRSVLLIAIAFSCLTAACSDSSEPAKGGPGQGENDAARSVTKSVGPDGATFDVAGATVTIPKGALTKTVDITISASEAGPPEGYVALSKVFECGPSGTEFAEPVVMKMPFSDDGRPSTMFWSTGADPTFDDIGGAASAGTMSATVRHFSSGFVGRKK